MVIGTTAAFFAIRKLEVSQGSGLPDLALGEGKQVAVIGQKLKEALFDNGRAVGQWIRLRDYRFRVIGVLAGSGDSFGADLSEAIFIPVASAQSVFNVHGMFRVMLKVKENYQVDAVKSAISKKMQALHDGEQDVTVVSPDSMLSTFDSILRVMTLAVAGYRGHQPGRIGHPGDERDADVGKAAHRGNRPAQGIGCARSPGAHPVSYRSGTDCSRRRSGGHGGRQADRRHRPAGLSLRCRLPLPAGRCGPHSAWPSAPRCCLPGCPRSRPLTWSPLMRSARSDLTCC